MAHSRDVTEGSVNVFPCILHVCHVFTVIGNNLLSPSSGRATTIEICVYTSESEFWKQTTFQGRFVSI